jgi:hypothetical protein
VAPDLEDDDLVLGEYLDEPDGKLGVFESSSLMFGTVFCSPVEPDVETIEAWRLRACISDSERMRLSMKIF